MLLFLLMAYIHAKAKDYFTIEAKGLLQDIWL